MVMGKNPTTLGTVQILNKRYSGQVSLNSDINHRYEMTIDR